MPLLHDNNIENVRDLLTFYNLIKYTHIYRTYRGDYAKHYFTGL
jgi:hypothetical protein